MYGDKIEIKSAPSTEVWYASYIGKKFTVLYEYKTHFEIKPKAKKWPGDVCLLVPVEDCVVVKKKKQTKNIHQSKFDVSYTEHRIGVRPWWYQNMSSDQQKSYDDIMEAQGAKESYRWY